MWLRLATQAMGTRFELLLEGRDRTHARAAGEAALELIEACDARWSRFRSDSLISRLNRAAGAAPLALDADTLELLARCLELGRDTQAAFDVCLGSAMDRLRTDAEASAALGALEVDREGSRARLVSAGTRLDLGAIGKGRALDMAREALLDQGVRRALLHGGTSSVMALGESPRAHEAADEIEFHSDFDHDGWGLALSASMEQERVCLSDEGFSLSAANVARGSALEAHVLEPHSGRALRSGCRAAVRARYAADADAWSTALLVLAERHGRDELVRRLEHMKLPQGFAGLLHFGDGQSPVHFRWQTPSMVQSAR
jgi:thiamine biosynthesis lipoprotein